MILINGCSFSTPTDLRKDLKAYIWPKLLANKLKTKLKIYAAPGKSNRLIYRELYTYLIWAKQGKVEMPKQVVMQTTDNFRDHFFKNSRSGELKPNNLISQMNMGNYVKMASWNGYLKLKKDNPNQKTLGAKLNVFVVGLNSKNKTLETREHEIDIGDVSLREPELRHALEIISLQQLCKSLNVKLCILPFFGFYSHNIDLDPLLSEIDQNDFCTTDMKNGIFYYLDSNGFDRTDGYHFNVDGHKFVSDTVYDFLVHNKKLEVNDNNFVTSESNIAVPETFSKSVPSLPRTTSFDYT